MFTGQCLGGLVMCIFICTIICTLVILALLKINASKGGASHRNEWPGSDGKLGLCLF